jgi:hypothetical protein
MTRVWLAVGAKARARARAGRYTGRAV